MADNVIPFDDRDDPFKRPPRFKLIPFEQIDFSTDARYLVKGILPKSGLVVVWGPPKSGKSFWTFDLVMAVARGVEYRGRRVQAGPVVYCAFEGQAGFQARVEAYRQKHLADQSDAAEPIPFYLSPASVDLVQDAPELITIIRQQVIGGRPAIVVLDTLNRSLRGSESNDEDMAAYIRAADAIREAFECLVIIVHHCGIDGTRPRGHTSLAGAADTQIAIKRDLAGHVTSTVELCKDGDEGATTLSKLEVVKVGFDDEGDNIFSCVIVPCDDEISTPIERVTGATKNVLEFLRKAVDDAGEEPPHSHHFIGARTVVKIEVWRTYCYAGTIAETDRPDAQQKAFARASQKLQAAKLIKVWGQFAWIL